MRLSQKTKNSVSVLVFLARSADRHSTVPEIAEGCEITEFNTFKLVPLLVRTGFLKTIRGRKGGVVLAKPAEEISVGAVVRATEDRFQEAYPAGSGGADREAITFDALVDDAFLAFVEILDRNTIAELAGGKSDPPRPPLRKRTRKQRQSTSAN